MTVGRDAAAGEEGRVSDSANWQRNCVHAKCGLWRGRQKLIRAHARTDTYTYPPRTSVQRTSETNAHVRMRIHTCTQGGSVRTRCRHLTQHSTHSAGPARAVCLKSLVADSPRIPPCLQEPGAGRRQLPRQGHAGATANEQQAAGRAPTADAGRSSASLPLRDAARAQRQHEQTQHLNNRGTRAHSDLPCGLPALSPGIASATRSPATANRRAPRIGAWSREKRESDDVQPPAPANKKWVASVLFQTTHHVLAHSSDDGAVRQARAQLHGQKPRGRQLILRMPADLWGEASCSTPCAAQPPGSASRIVEAPW